jgi:hypothetical protein
LANYADNGRKHRDDGIRHAVLKLSGDDLELLRVGFQHRVKLVAVDVSQFAAGPGGGPERLVVVAGPAGNVVHQDVEAGHLPTGGDHRGDNVLLGLGKIVPPPRHQLDALDTSGRLPVARHDFNAHLTKDVNGVLSRRHDPRNHGPQGVTGSRRRGRRRDQGSRHCRQVANVDASVASGTTGTLHHINKATELDTGLVLNDVQDGQFAGKLLAAQPEGRLNSDEGLGGLSGIHLADDHGLHRRFGRSSEPRTGSTGLRPGSTDFGNLGLLDAVAVRQQPEAHSQGVGFCLDALGRVGQVTVDLADPGVGFLVGECPFGRGCASRHDGQGEVVS